MDVLNVSADYLSENNTINDENDDSNIILKYSLLSIPSGVVLPSLIRLIIGTNLRTLLTNK